MEHGTSGNTIYDCVRLFQSHLTLLADINFVVKKALEFSHEVLLNHDSPILSSVSGVVKI